VIVLDSKHVRIKSINMYGIIEETYENDCLVFCINSPDKLIRCTKDDLEFLV